jgi:hypothetical protein
MSPINAALVALFVVGAVLSAALGHGSQAVALAAAGLGGAAGALHARRPGARDVTRLNALEWRDERDRALGLEALSVVGGAALLLSVLELLLVVPVVPELRWVALVQTMILGALWAAANSFAVRRG